ncbi:MAG: sigma-70 family RNA polymerase sigma factor [Catenulispora sp.]
MAGAEAPESFDAFYAATSHRVVGYLYVVLGNLADAEDAAHEAYARAWQRWTKLRHYEDPEGWVRTVAFRVAVSAWRKAVNRLSAHRARPVENAPDLSPDRLAIVAALKKLPPEQRRALVLFHLQGLSVDAISIETGAPSGTVKARLARGRRALAPLVWEFADDEPRSTKKGVASDV